MISRRDALTAPCAEVRELSEGWRVASVAADECADPSGLDRLEWLPAQVPGTAASALRAAGHWKPGDERDFDSQDWWFHTVFDTKPAGEDEELVLALDGLATVTEVYLNGERILDSESMFAAHRLDVTGRVRTTNELAIRCRALAPLLRPSRRPRARWRTRLVAQGNLRFYRTMLLGRAPGLSPGPAVVGPWRPVRLERWTGFVLDDLRVRSRLDAGSGRLSLQARLRGLGSHPPSLTSAAVELSGAGLDRTGELEVDSNPAETAASGELNVPGVEPWWPHTHGTPALYHARLLIRSGDRELVMPAGEVGFRTLRAVGELERDGLQLCLNGVNVFARGAVWTPPDLASPCSSPETLRTVLGAAVSAGMNMLRVPGIAAYEGDEFYDLCDELGILVWQDFMFANLDYPESDPEFMAVVEREAREVLASLGRRVSLAVLCGSSEAAQQATMLGLDPLLANGPLYAEMLPSLVTEAEVDAPYFPSTPWGGDVPFRPDRGVANYYGVGAYRRPLEDARRAEVRFAAECLAFANVPDEDVLEAMEVPGGIVVNHPRWKAAVPRDVGAGWDFDDVRDHYLRLLFDVDPVALRAVDHERYLWLSRHVTGEVMAEVMGEWRRRDSPCGGALVLWLTDLVPGAGWGLLDHRGQPKAAFHYLRRALAPVAVWSIDEGLGGVVAHVANDRATPLQATLRIATYRELEVPVDEVEDAVALEPHSARSDNVETLLGRFVDLSWSYRFGPPAQDLIALSLERPGHDGTELLSQSFRFPAGRPPGRESVDRLGVVATASGLGDGARLIVSTRRFLYGVCVFVPGYAPEDDAFSVEPGHSREIKLRSLGETTLPPVGHLTALNLAGRVKVGS